MKFWKIEPLEYESDYHDKYINGSLEHPYGLPPVECDVCGQTWGSNRVLSYQCPLSIRDNKQIKSGWPVSVDEYRSLEKRLLSELEKDGIKNAWLKPGDTLQPCYLDIPSKPVADFLWPSMISMVVSERIKDFLLEQCHNDIETCPVVLRKVGKRDSKIPPLIPASGEPEDMIDEITETIADDRIGTYFEICIKAKSGLPPGTDLGMICPSCKRRKIDNSRREIRMTEGMWKGNNIFFLATTLYVIITDDIKRMLECLRPTNVVFSEIWQNSKSFV